MTDRDEVDEHDTQYPSARPEDLEAEPLLGTDETFVVHIPLEVPLAIEALSEVEDGHLVFHPGTFLTMTVLREDIPRLAADLENTAKALRSVIDQRPITQGKDS